MSKAKKVRYKRSYSLWALVYWFLSGAIFCLAICFAMYWGIFRAVVESSVQNQAKKEVTVLLNSDYDADKQIGAMDGLVVSIETNVDTSRVGRYTTKYSVFFGKEFEQTVRVVDGEPPRITLNGEKTMLVGNIENWEDPGATAYDAYDGDVTYKIRKEITQVDDETYKVIYRVEDNSGYSRTAQRTLKKATGVVCLTFDDGPSLSNTPKILDTLQRYNVKATFFVLSFDIDKIDIVKRELEEGHTVGLHGISHEYSEIYQNIDTLMNNFYMLEDHISNNVDSGYQAKFIRFPGGSSNTVSRKYCQGIMTEATQRATEEGFVYVDWNVDSSDAGGANTADEIYQNVINGIKPGNTNIILMHDADTKEATAEALEKIIQYCIEKGYVIEPINDATEIAHHTVAN